MQMHFPASIVARLRRVGPQRVDVRGKQRKTQSNPGLRNSLQGLAQRARQSFVSARQLTAGKRGP
jgi:hypothetical protein